MKCPKCNNPLKRGSPFEGLRMYITMMPTFICSNKECNFFCDVIDYLIWEKSCQDIVI